MTGAFNFIAFYYIKKGAALKNVAPFLINRKVDI